MQSEWNGEAERVRGSTTYCRGRQTVIEEDASPVWEEVTWGRRGMNRPDKGALRALVRCHLGAERECATIPAPVIWSKVTPPQCDSVAPECCFQACSALLEDESLNFSLLFLERIPFLCSSVSAPKGTLVSASPPHEGRRRFDQTIWWAVILIRVR